MEMLDLLPLQAHESSLNLKNKKLSEQTKSIKNLLYGAKRSIFEISVRLVIIRNEKLYEDDFKDVFEYAEKVLGYKKNMVYKLMVTAEKFIEENPQGGYVSILVHDNEDYTVSQLIELNSIESDEAIRLDELEVISPNMTTREIREVVKAYKRGEIDENGNSVSINSENNEETERETNEPNVIDGTALSIMNIITDISKLLDDERIIKDSLKVAKLQEMKKFLESINL